jgi:hypothetical protein
MAKYPPLQQEQIKSLILDCNIRRMTNIETHQYLRERGIDIGIATVKNYKAKLRGQAQAWISRLARSKKADYIAEYKARIDEVYGYQKRLWEIANNPQTGPRTQVEAIGKLLDTTAQLIALYDSLPLINAIRDVTHTQGDLQEHQDASQDPQDYSA